ncbi:MAG: TonB-dependent receptor, partial [Rubrivivax sp.]|nr:TonB-dependent receptor [Rubrivivax sp.]
GPVTQLSVSASQTRYGHQEVEGSGVVGTRFDSLGSELRVEARHAPVGPLRGVFGLHLERLQFQAQGEEAFMPATRSRSNAAFLLEEMAAGPLQLGLGLRLQSTQVASAGDALDANSPRFGAALQRRFAPVSGALSLLWPLAGSGWTVNAALGHTERAPAHFELYANGAHLATAAFERGDSGLGVERSRHADIGLAWRRGAHSAQLNVFATRFARFISLDATGASITVPGEADEVPTTLPEYAFRGVRALAGRRAASPAPARRRPLDARSERQRGQRERAQRRRRRSLATAGAAAHPAGPAGRARGLASGPELAPRVAPEPSAGDRPGDAGAQPDRLLAQLANIDRPHRSLVVCAPGQRR